MIIPVYNQKINCIKDCILSLLDQDVEHIENKTLIDCLSGVRQLPREMAEKILTGVMMISYADRKMRPLEVRWASMLASAIEVSPADFQRCCVNARVIASMLRPHGAPA